MGDAEFELALTAHLRAVRAVMDYVDGNEHGGYTLRLFANECLLGRWLAGEGRRFADLSDYQRVADLHERFHAMMRTIVAIADQGERSEALAYFNPGGEFPRISRELLIACGDLTDAIAGRRNLAST